jgi:hypothetical protein
MSYLNHIRNCNTFTPEKYHPFMVDDEQMGWVDKVFSSHLKNFEDVFTFDENKLAVNANLQSPDQRTQAIAPILEKLHQDKVIDSWVGEPYAVTHTYGETPKFLMERAAVSFFGVRGYGVHINGLVKKADGLYIWIARRTRDKPFWPGMLDQMVAGGQPAGIGRMDNVIKESAEEANIPTDIAQTAKLMSEIHYRGESHRGMHVDTLFNYDLYLPEDFNPENTDGEVDEFILMSLDEMAHLTEATTEFKDNCNLVNIDLLLRRGLIDESHTDYAEIRRKLYAPIT